MKTDLRDKRKLLYLLPVYLLCVCVCVLWFHTQCHIILQHDNNNNIWESSSVSVYMKIKIWKIIDFKTCG